MVTHFISSRFALGHVVITAGVDKYFNQDTQGQILINGLLDRHANKDDGDLCQEDKEMNIQAHKEGGRIFSLYNIGENTLYIITEADRSVTTILFDCEY